MYMARLKTLFSMIEAPYPFEVLPLLQTFYSAVICSILILPSYAGQMLEIIKDLTHPLHKEYGCRHTECRGRHITLNTVGGHSNLKLPKSITLFNHKYKK